MPEGMYLACESAQIGKICLLREAAFPADLEEWTAPLFKYPAVLWHVRGSQGKLDI